MRPLRLSMQAFGPFAGKQELDFRDLGDNRLFLIHGETGAGKSTILDGICAALYGESAGDERSPEEMRSHHAAPDVPTELEFDFAIGDKTYRIRRLPEQERPKKRGSGTTKMSAEVVLRELSGPEPGAAEGAVLAERKTKVVLAKVIELLGLEASQFRQVVVLPQGQFRRLLTAESAERETILEKLFDTAAYLRVERKLLDEKKALKKKIGNAMTLRQGKLATQEVDTPEALEAKIESQKEGLSALEKDLAEKKGDAAKKTGALTAGKTIAKRFEERDAAKAKLAELKADAAKVVEERRRLGDAKEAAKLEAPFDRRQNAETDLRSRVASEATAKAELARAGEEVKGAREGAKQAGDERAGNTERREELAIAKKRVEALETWTGRTREREASEKKLETAAAEREAKGAARDAHQEERRLADERLASTKSSEADRVRAEGDLKTAKARVEAHGALSSTAKKLELAVKELERAELERAEVKTTADIARQTLAALTAAQMAGSAARLASALEDGEPCPVCGAEHHPHPAEGSEDLPSEEALEAAAKANEAAQAKTVSAEGAVAGAKTKVEALEAERDERREALGGESSTQASEAFDAAQAALTAAELRERERGAAAAGLKALDEKSVDVEKAAADARETMTKAAAALESAKAEEAKANQELGDGERDLERLERRAVEVEAKIAAVEKAHEAAQAKKQAAEVAEAAADKGMTEAAKERRDAEETQKKRREAWTAALDASPFDDEAAFTAARMDAAALESLEASLKRRDEELAAAQATIEAHDTALEDAERPDLDALDEASANAEAAAEEASAKVAQTKTQLEAAAKVLAEVRDDQKETAELEQRYSLVGGLADAANGENGARLSLHRFVLSAFLDDVLFTASEHLARMSRGRYRLARREVVADRRKKHGLDLNVTDHFTGQDRPATTLSGGEGFLAALALALGLADVVQAHAGGIRLETVFVDEGFGSLDPETLDLAVGTLLELQKSGRLVGVISHVGELKERIDVRLEVEKTDQGSEARFRLPG